ncbi:hypothetical protein SAMN05444673_3470 [Bacillus sp. OV166]|nr:hypothetical protein SAMN05444673_3470 [Bacillus sp. OV166]
MSTLIANKKRIKEVQENIDLSIKKVWMIQIIKKIFDCLQ